MLPLVDPRIAHCRKVWLNFKNSTLLKKDNGDDKTDDNDDNEDEDNDNDDNDEDEDEDDDLHLEQAAAWVLVCST